MANYFDEGNTATGSPAELSTSDWLKSNKLGHLVSIFEENELELSELVEMDENSLIDLLKAVGLNAISIPRIKSKIIKLKKQNSNDNKQQTIQQIIITEAEQTAMKSLNDKSEELKQEQKSIENSLNEIEKEHIKQKESVQSSFNEIILKIEERKNVLLNNMDNTVNQYKNELHELLKQNGNNQSSLTKIQNQYDFNIKESAKSTSKMSSSVDVIQKRSNKNVSMIDEILLYIKPNYNNHEVQHITFNIEKYTIISDINKWGIIQMSKENINYNEQLSIIKQEQSASQTDIKEEYYQSVEDDGIEEGKTVKVTSSIKRLDAMWAEAELGINEDIGVYLGAVGKIMGADEDDDTVQLRWANYTSCWIPVKACVSSNGAEPSLPADCI